MLKTKHKCKGRDCNAYELAYAQIHNQAVTKTLLIKKSNLNPINSYSELNPNLPSPPEIPYFMSVTQLNDEEKKIDFNNMLVGTVFDTKSINSKTSILNPKYGEPFMKQMEENVSLNELEYKYVLKSKNYALYTFLYKYIRFIITQFGDYISSKGTSKDSALSALIRLAVEKSIVEISYNIQYTLYARQIGRAHV